MSEDKFSCILEAKHSVPPNVTPEQFKKMYKESIENPDKFWLEQAKKYFEFYKEGDKICDCDAEEGRVKWFSGYYTNTCNNVLDRHLEVRGDCNALIWEGNEPDTHESFTYRQLHQHVCKMANVLKKMGVKKGDRVCLYMPMRPEAVFAILACYRIGAIHVNVYSSLSVEALIVRLQESGSSIVLTADEDVSGRKRDALKEKVNAALKECPDVRHTLVFHYTGLEYESLESDVVYDDIVKEVDDVCECEPMECNEPIFCIFSSGSTSKPKGIVHTAAFALYVALVIHLQQDLHSSSPDNPHNDISWCMGNIGWIASPAYGVLGPLANGACTLLYEGDLMYPTPSRVWDIVDKHKVTAVFTQPTLLRMQRALGEKWIAHTSRESLRTLVLGGEPMSETLWRWVYEVICRDGMAVPHHIWGQSEAAYLCVITGVCRLKAGGVIPFLGMEPVLVDDAGCEIEGEGTGTLLLKKIWPGCVVGCWGNEEAYMDAYWRKYPGYYFTGDSASRDKEGLYTIIGRVDDVIKTGYAHRIGTTEVENTIVSHPAVAEVAAVGCPHPIMGRGLYLFVRLFPKVSPSEAIKKQFSDLLEKKIGHIAKPSAVQWVSGLPKTLSGKMMRRICRNIANGSSDYGDISGLANPEIIPLLVKDRIVVGEEDEEDEDE
ncbi:Acetyl-coenzyme A synthetase [Aduncisulcus paluster]|uniref:acetate--CoA ligase n=1 Tax=Aduncisulcus paluster TaxID=2918883 RepID=A0ABQ5K0H2_9EUKA|nr:Acetyl-coenzyme A synthetase [Aduncisulcus paluster]|eukprot:gnl/Carplike_NY0171/3314_a4459_440.p1 GENE.gnl/Carplike_NY0171/3314_a4459_440~~gnl/Carplike_NY0171/3314_a4459_440.p1  ORF type:complete len:672 (+),score=210.66 gnl/Carplike_NY0171/3314_a4459_440:37-2016(+)